MPRIFSSDDEELKYINDYFGNFRNSEQTQQTTQVESINPANPKYNKPITITKKERLVIAQSIRYNDNYVMPFIADERVIKSLHEKGFIEKGCGEELFMIKKNVCLLFEIEGEAGFDEILEG